MTSNLYKSYRAQQFQGDTRIDLLLRLYRVTLDKIREAQDRCAADANDPDVLRCCLRAVELVKGIQLALDPNHGEVPQNVSRLCDFVAQQLLLPASVSPMAERLASCHRILTNLMEGYASVRQAAIDYERDHLTQPDVDVLVDATC